MQFVNCYILMILFFLPGVSIAGIINGSILDSTGCPVSKAEICLYSADYFCQNNDSCHFPSGALNFTKSSKSGKYQFKHSSSDNLVIIGKKGSLWFYRRLLLKSHASELSIIDTLNNPGSLRFFVTLEKSANKKNITVHLLGTPFFSKSSNDGQLEIKAVPKGNYQALIRSNILGYNAVQCSLRIHPALCDTFHDTLNLSYSTPFPIQEFKSHVDSSSKIRLSWKYNGPAKTRFTIFKSINKNPFSSLAFTFNKTFIDIVSDSLKRPAQISYFIECDNICYTSDTNNILIQKKQNIKTKDDSFTKKQKTEKQIFRVILQSDSAIVYPLQQIHLRGSVEPEGISIRSWQWSINGAPFTESVQPDTIITAPVKNKLLTCILKAIDNFGQLSYDTLTFKVQSSKLKVFAKKDSKGGLFEKITLSAHAISEHPVISLSWDIGNTGNFTPTANGRLSIGPFHSPVGTILCIARVIDETGESAFDSISLETNYRWGKYSPASDLSGRKSHVLVSFNDAVWLIGGSDNDIWNSYDAKNWNIVNEKAQFGSRYGHVSISFDNKLWVIGGKIGSDSLPGDVWNSFDGKIWKKVSENSFLKRYYHSATVFQNQIFVIGGLNDSSNNTCANDIWTSKDGIRWLKITPDKEFVPRYGHGAVVFNNSIFLVGGLYQDFNGSKTISDIWSSPNGHNWNKISNNQEFPNNHFLSCIVYDTRLWVIGGFLKNSKSVFSTVWNSTDGVTWEKSADNEQQSEGFHITGTVFNNQIIMSPSGSNDLFVLR